MNPYVSSYSSYRKFPEMSVYSLFLIILLSIFSPSSLQDVLILESRYPNPFDLIMNILVTVLGISIDQDPVSIRGKRCYGVRNQSRCV